MEYPLIRHLEQLDLPILLDLLCTETMNYLDSIKLGGRNEHTERLRKTITYIQYLITFKRMPRQTAPPAQLRAPRLLP